MSAWPRPRYWEDRYIVETPPDAEEVTLAHVDSSGFDRHDAWEAQSSRPLFRTHRVPFYPDLLLVECRFERPFDEGALFGAWLFAPMRPENKAADSGSSELAIQGPTTDSESPRRLFHLEGSSASIHDANAQYSFAAKNRESAVAYVKFFCAFVWGDAGGFWVCESGEDIPWNENAPSSLRERAAKSIAPLQATLSGEGKWSIEACILYDARIFRARLSLDGKAGTLEMADDEPLIREQLPVLPDRRLHGFRIVAPA